MPIDQIPVREILGPRRRVAVVLLIFDKDEIGDLA